VQTDAGDLVIAVSLVVSGVALAWHFVRGRALVEGWAQRQGYTLEACECRWLRRGPYLWMSSNAQAVYRVKVRTRDGRLRRGWVRCGGWLSGVLSDQVDVRWDARAPEG
jgi:hypothetical protein